MDPLSVRLAVSRFLDPALLLLVALGVGLVLWRREARPATRAGRAGQGLAAAGWVGLWVLASPWFANLLVHHLQDPGVAVGAAFASVPPGRRAMVVLSGGRRTDENGVPPSERLDSVTQGRIMGAARLYEAHGFDWVVLSGGAAEDEGMAELITRLGVPRERLLLESASTDTRSNARNSVALLRAKGLDTAVLATSALHLRRATWEFERHGFHVVPAAVEIVGFHHWGVEALVPSSEALALTDQALHEVLGYLKPADPQDVP